MEGLLFAEAAHSTKLAGVLCWCLMMMYAGGGVMIVNA